MNIFQSRLTKRAMLSLILCGLLLGAIMGGMVNLTAGVANAAPPVREQAAPMGDDDEGGDDGDDGDEGDNEGGNEGNEGGNEGNEGGNEGNEGGNEGNEDGNEGNEGGNESQHKDEAAPPLTAGATCDWYTEAAVTGGFSVCDDANAQFRTAFARYGLQNVGYPISIRYMRDGFITQAFQKAILQWRADANQVAFVNVFDELHNGGFDERLLNARQTPQQFPAGWDGDATTFEEVKAKRQALLNARPALYNAYFAASDPLLFFGLPTSDIEDMGNHYAIRLQRAVLQEWKEDVPWAAAGEVTVANGGDIAKELAHLPQTSLFPESSSESGEAGEGGEEGGHGEGGEEGGHGEGGEGEGEGEGGEGEESAQTYGKNETYDQVRNGARLVIAYDATSTSFKGTVQNTTSQTLCRVRVEVHVVGGSELGPTTPTDLAPGETMNVELSAAGETFERWSAHPELSACSGGEGSSD